MSEKDKYSIKEKIILLILMLGLLVTKWIYVILSLLLLARIKCNKNIDKKKIIVILFACLAILFAYIILTNLNYTIYPKYSLLTIIRNPFDFISLFINTIQVNGNKYLGTMFGSSLGWLEININGIYTYTYIFVLLFATIIDKIKINKMQIIAMIFSVALVVTSISAGFLTIYSHRSEDVIFGIQGRYFIPIAILIFYIISYFAREIKLNIEYNKSVKLFSIILIIIHVLIIVQVMRFYM